MMHLSKTSAVEAMRNDALKLIAYVLLESLHGSATAGWSRGEAHGPACGF